MRAPRAAAVLVVVAVAVAVVVGACGGGGDATPGARLPDLSLPALDGQGPDLDTGELVGPAVVNLWATWCAPCRAELPAFQAVAAARPDVRFVGVDTQETGEARAYLDELGIGYEQYVDRRGELGEALGAAALPVTIVLDAGGSITTRHLGPMTAADLEDALDDASG